MKNLNNPAAGFAPRLARGRGRHAGARRAVLLLGWLLAACGGSDGGGGTGPGVNPVATVTVTGAPAEPVLAGSTVQLTATPANAAGSALPNRAVTWQSGDTTIAKVSDAGLVSVVGAGSVTITARSEGKEGTAALDARAGGPLGPDGGTLDLLGGRIKLAVPRGSLSNPITLLFRPAVSPPADPRLVPGTAWELGPATFFFSPNAVLTLAYDPARLPAGVPEASLQLYALVNGSWQLMRGTQVDPATHTVRGSIERWGTFAVVGTPANTVRLSGELVSGALYAGQTRPLTAAAVNAFGDTLRGRTIAWSSSDPARATVDAAGNVTGVSAGTVTLTAAVDTARASTTVTVLPRPLASWRQTAEWSTLHGNPRHDGYVAATLDPAAFRQLWVRTLLVDDFFVRPPATGAGKVFVSTGRHGQTQRLSALDAATGAESWSRTFGTAEFVSSPAFGHGRVYTVVRDDPQPSLRALNAVDGTVLFNTAVTDPQGAGVWPVVSGDGVYISGGAVHRFDAMSGARSYSAVLPGTSGGPLAVAGGQVLSYVNDGLSVLNAADGTLVRTLTGFQTTSYTPVLGGAGNLLVPNGQSLSSIDLQSGAAVWSQPGAFASVPVVGNGVVYAPRGEQVVAMREADGSVLWTWSPPLGNLGRSLLLTDNILFVGTDAGLFGSRRYFTFGVDLASGKQVWFHPSGGEYALGAGGTLFIASLDGTLTAIAVR